jgi:hypothetical protein
LGESVKIKFEFSTSDLAEVASRTVNRSPLVHRWRLRNTAAGAVLAGLLAFAIVPGDMAIRIAAGLIIALGVFVVAMYLLSRPRRNTRTEAFFRERLGGDGPFTCEVELTSAGVVSRQLGQELYHSWSHVASVSEVPEGVEFIYTPIGSLLVRDRAFPDPQVRADFVSLARSHIPESAQSKATLGRMPEPSFVAGPTEREYFIAWLLFFVCVSITGSLVSSAIGSGAAAILRMPGAAPAYAVYIFAGLSFIVTGCLSYVFFRLFAKRLVSRVQERLTVNAA